MPVFKRSPPIPISARRCLLTLAYTTVSVVLNVSLALGCALLLGGPPISAGNTFLRLAIYRPVIAPNVAGLNVWKWMYDQSFGVVNAVLGGLGLPELGGLADQHTALWAVAIAEIWQHVGFYTIFSEQT